MRMARVRSRTLHALLVLALIMPCVHSTTSRRRQRPSSPRTQLETSDPSGRVRQLEATQGRIPNRLLNSLKTVGSTSEFLRRFVVNRRVSYPPSRPPGAPGIGGGGEPDGTFDLETGSITELGIQMVAGSTAPMAEGCVPRRTAVHLPGDSNPNVIMWPLCVEMMRCGGCCLRGDEECVPTETRARIEPVVRAVYTHPGSLNFEFDGIEEVPLDEHITCRCQCRIQAHHCDPIKHSYDQEACLCRCHNENEAPYCPSYKRWDPMQCACVCPQVSYCEDNMLFNFQTCSCEAPSNLQVMSTTPNPCATFRCRPLFTPLTVDGRCTCRRSSQWGIQGRK